MSIVWCNALSEYLGFIPVYLIDGEVLRDSVELSDEETLKDLVAQDRNGFPLPTSHEWELSAPIRGVTAQMGL